ncbi:MAG TPA: bifunctional UDP-N-acetylglucosamine diphosphorylase/glucosamine-1-phosphate N-acetyltransferase GlmU [Rhodopila sp.]|uniref:bifunctional UDP-N-acetylglucosamine diphosphorylase/glucosamine-1-phosphate N-acetyltransferase GlmU n=1 Tax=Rhodopila sp. TaxID=2480087 RepID=UPI002B90961D|nr:bifunctional UDP-N-acetylglucosamine diphosphorylase/glucosamine-1-phosphate N-acetyltransferase GlmU [Rhodopila sp.]HVY14429.1 bifunctional UDP-N-acetylglucosamine diphosphorylase/glucosamine-1-phosphate N-acetyltransferase GlmU [Rhodopila sp.]
MQATAIVLAAGLGTRMKSALPKTLHRLAGRSMLRHLLASCEQVFDRVVVVLGPDMDAVRTEAAPHACVVQHDRLGTAHAALQAVEQFGDGKVAVLYADNPLIRPETMRRLLTGGAADGLSLLAFQAADPARYGRVVTGGQGMVERIVEYADASEAERAITLCNAGVMCAAAGDMARWLRAVRNDNAKGEYYLTDVIAIARAAGRPVRAVEAPEAELAGINSRAELAKAEAVLQSWLRAAAMDAGVTMVDPASVFLSADTELASDVTIEPNVVFGPGVKVASNVTIRAFSHIEGATIGAGSIIGPFARLRPGAVLENDVHVGNYVEIKASHLGAGVKANHLTYVGDATVGARTNLGAGTITCNYDGHHKHRTTIGADAFIGSDVSLVAPVTVGDGAYVATGSVITDDVEPDALAIARQRQVQKPGRALMRKDKG